LTQAKGNFAEKGIITLVFEKNANFFDENWQKLQKIVIPGMQDCQNYFAF
jgi:hypothetical protein